MAHVRCYQIEAWDTVRFGNFTVDRRSQQEVADKPSQLQNLVVSNGIQTPFFMTCSHSRDEGKELSHPAALRE